MNWEKLENIDVRILYGLVLACLIIPMFKPIGLPIAISENSRKVYDTIENLPDGSIIWVSHDTGTGNAPELNPALTAFARQAFRKDCKIVATALMNELIGPTYVQEYIGEVADEMGKEYGVDWVNIGFRLSPEATMKMLAEDVWEAVNGVDWKGTPLDEFPLMKDVRSFRNDVDLLFTTMVGTPGAFQWIRYIGEPLKIPITGSASLTMYAGVQHYIRSGQLQGYLGGLRGAAEYEQLVGFAGQGLSGMDAQSMGHLTIIIFLIFGNVGYFMKQKANRQ